MLDKYNAQEIESKRGKIREEKGYFEAKMEEGKPNYSIVIPPPNVTGILHMGHVLDLSIQDVLVRRKRMSGYNTLWMPGTDHAGIATQNKVERSLAEEGLTKEDIGRDAFLERTWQWKEKYGGVITTQQRKFGASLDWKKERFTMDEGLSEAVKQNFVDLYRDGLIYQGEYIVNRCPRCGTALADDEVDYADKEGNFWEIRYPILGSEESLILATTRPETMLGDTGVAVNPDDPRYQHLIGKKVIVPLVNREVPIVADHYVDMEFGTGVVKMTPAHDPNDFEVGKRTGLEILNILTPDAKINENGGKYAGLDRFEARKQIVADLEAQGYLVQVKKHNHAVGHCYRCNTVIEPRVSKQWFVKMKPLAEPALEAVRSGKIKIQPKRWEKVYYNWLENIRDRCISRQIWWGHRIPAWYGPDGQTFVAKNEQEAKNQAFELYQKEVELTQETDVLDTWFSSALWPFSTMGWPEKTELLQHFYPTSTLVTGADIIFFRVARMVMMGMYQLGEVPFHDVMFHGIVRDELGRKMSKSLGNSPDPLDLVAEYGADAIRFTMIYNTSAGQDVHFSEKLLEMGRNFANKVWNATNFVLMNLEGFDPQKIEKSDLNFELVDRWIYSRLHTTIQQAIEKLDSYTLDEAAKLIYEFIRGDFCDWYLEMAKVRLYGNTDQQSKNTAQWVLWDVLKQSLQLLHPFMPFITEELWQQLGTGEETIMLSRYPIADPSQISQSDEQAMSYIQEVITSLRNIRAEANIAPGVEIDGLVRTENSLELEILTANKAFLMKLAKLKSLEFGKEIQKPDLSGFRVVGNSEIIVPLLDFLDVEAEKKKLQDQISKLEQGISSCERKLNDQVFMGKAPEHIIQRERDNLAEYQQKVAKLQENIKLLG
ncbi:valine--tRNA ligase [Candidatus Gracilibacteria bacterium]|nr:MAG: valine--tRNA ligase [Candidatus Gracilibacteria bacterium]